MLHKQPHHQFEKAPRASKRTCAGVYREKPTSCCRKVFDLTLPLAQVAEGYRAMDERRAIKALLKPWTTLDVR